MIPATGNNYNAVPSASAPSPTAVTFGHAPQYPHDQYQASNYRPEPTGPKHYSIGERFQLGVKNALNGKNLRKSFFRSLFLFLLTLPTAAIIPGPQIAVLPIAMGVGATLRFFKGLRHPEKIAQKLQNH